MSQNPSSYRKEYQPILERFRKPWIGYAQLLTTLMWVFQPLPRSRAVYVPDVSGAQPPYYWVPTSANDSEPSSGPNFDDADSNGIPDWRDDFNNTAANGTLAWWGGGNFMVSGCSRLSWGSIIH